MKLIANLFTHKINYIRIYFKLLFSYVYFVFLFILSLKLKLNYEYNEHNIINYNILTDARGFAPVDSYNLIQQLPSNKNRSYHFFISFETMAETTDSQLLQTLDRIS